MTDMLRCTSVLLVAAMMWPGVQAQDWPEPEGPKPRILTPVPGHIIVDSSRETPQSPLGEFRSQLKQMQREREALQTELKVTRRWVDSEPPADEELPKLQSRVGGLLREVTRRTPASVPAKKSEEPASKPVVEKVEPRETPPPKVERKASPPAESEPPRFTHIADPLLLGQALYRAGNYRDALYALNRVPLDGLKAQERAPVKYLIATCLRKQEKWDEAAALYREIANSVGDEQLAACAQWQIASIRWQQDMRRQLEQIRERRKALEKTP